MRVQKQQYVSEKAQLSWSHVISLRTLLTYASLDRQTCPVTISPCAHNIPRPSSCIIASCLLVAAGASQWPRYNESLWPSSPAACSPLTPPPATSLLSAITAWPTSPWLPVQNGSKEEAARRGLLATMTPVFWRSGWEWVQNSADNSLRIRVTSFTRPHQAN